MEKQLRHIIVQLVDGQPLHFSNQPLAAGSVETAHQVSFFHGKKHNHISISFDFGFFVCSGFLAPLSGAVWACSLSFARTEVFFWEVCSLRSIASHRLSAGASST